MGSMTIRFPESLHERVRELAEEEGISMNQFVTMATAEKAAALRERAALQVLEERAERARERAEEQGTTVAGLLRDLLGRGPDEDPMPGDELPEELR